MPSPLSNPPEPYGQPPAAPAFLHTPAHQPPSGPPPRKRRKLPWILGGIALVLALCCGGTAAIVVIGGNSTDSRPAPATKPTSFAPLTDRDWKQIAKNPDAYSGKGYVVYGTVLQFDAATGKDQFRASVGARNLESVWEYDTNTVLTARPELLGDLVEDDEFRAEVMVVGAMTYDNVFGGGTVVPKLEVQSIKVLP